MKVAKTVHGSTLTLEGDIIRHRRVEANEASLEELEITESNISNIFSKNVEFISRWDGSFALKKNGFYGSAEPFGIELAFNRTLVGAWERFVFSEIPIETKPGMTAEESVVFFRDSSDILDTREPINESYRENSVGHSNYKWTSLETAPTLGQKFDRILLNASDNYEVVILQIRQSLNLLSPQGLIYMEYCDTDEAARAVISMAAEGLAWPTRPQGQRQSPFFQFISPRRPKVTTQKRIILVAVFGSNASAEWIVSRPTTEAYACRVDAELLVVQGELPPSERVLAKMHALDRVPSGARVLLLDTDIIIRKNAPDLFEIVPSDTIGVFVESLISERSHELENVSKLYKVTIKNIYYANTGVLLLPENSVVSFNTSAMPEEMYVDEMYEQNFFNSVLHRQDFCVLNLSSYFNTMPALCSNAIAVAYFVHFAGGSIKAQHYNVWERAKSSSGNTIISVKRILSPKDLRIFDLRNEMMASLGKYDELYPANMAHSISSKLRHSDGFSYYECEQGDENPSVFIPLGERPANSYDIEIILCRKALDWAMFNLSLSDRIDKGVSSRVHVEIRDGYSDDVILSKSSFHVVDGVAKIFVKTSVRSDMNVWICGECSLFSFHGVRISSSIVSLN